MSDTPDMLDQFNDYDRDLLHLHHDYPERISWSERKYDESFFSQQCELVCDAPGTPPAQLLENEQ